jgi:hypothetical protein
MVIDYTYLETNALKVAFLNKFIFKRKTSKNSCRVDSGTQGYEAIVCSLTDVMQRIHNLCQRRSI